MITDGKLEVVCNKCGKEFAVGLKSKPVRGSIKTLYFECPVCGEYYEVLNTSAKSRELENRLRLQFNDYTENRTNKTITENLDKIEGINKTKAELAAELRKIN